MVYFIAVFIPVLTLGSYLIVNTRSLILKQDYARLKSDNLRVRSILVDMTISIDTVGMSFALDEELQRILGEEYETNNDMYQELRLYSQFDYYQANHPEISQIDLYLNVPIEYGNFRKKNTNIESADWYQKALEKAQPFWISRPITNSVGYVEYQFCYVRRIPIIKTGDYAVLVIAANKNHMKSRINNNVLVTDITVNEDKIFYSDIRDHIGWDLEVGIDYDAAFYQYSGETVFDNKEVLLELSTIIPVSCSDKIYVMTTDYSSVSNIRHITFICVLLGVLCLIVPFIMIMIYTQNFSKRFVTLRHAMHKVSVGDYKISQKLQGNDELAEVYRDLQKMINSIVEMDKQIYSARIKEEKIKSHQQRIQYEMLASQINPHFLYNTLETIRMKALSVEDREVSNAIKLLGKALRHVLENSLKTVTLESELEYIKVYLQIQHIRFGDRIRYQIEVQESLDTKGYYLLPLLIQPIVENAFSHGIESQTSEGDLLINIYEEEEYLIISVRDNGQGMTKEELDLLIQHMKLKEISKGERIGLHNIYQRIKLFYGDEYGITITSEPLNGTVVKIRLPIISVGQIALDESLYNRV